MPAEGRRHESTPTHRRDRRRHRRDGLPVQLAAHCDKSPSSKATPVSAGMPTTIELRRCGGARLEGAVTHGVDTGFLVFNRRTSTRRLVARSSPIWAWELRRLRDVALGPGAAGWCPRAPRMGRHQPERRVRRPRQPAAPALPRDAVGPAAVQPLSRPRFAESGDDLALARPLAGFLADHRFGTAFRDDYLLPMIGCICCRPTAQMLRFPSATLIRFCHNHGLLQVRDRPQWYTARWRLAPLRRPCFAGRIGDGSRRPCSCVARGVGVGGGGRVALRTA